MSATEADAGHAKAADGDAFAASRAGFDSLVGWLFGAQASNLEHAELETYLQVSGRELPRQLTQDHLDLRAHREQRLPEVIDTDGVSRTHVEADHTRTLATVFGEVRVTRLAYRARGHTNLHPADAALNLPAEKHSHGLRPLAAIEASRGSFDGALEAIERTTGVRLGKRQVEGLATKAAADFDTFYDQRRAPSRDSDELPLVLSYDGTGVVMRRDALRPATAKAAATSTTKLATRLSKGEKRNRKRMAEVGAVYDALPAIRGPADILPATDEQRRTARPGPVAANKWLTVSVTNDAATVIGGVFDEAQRRDPGHQRRWIALVDGNKHQIDRTHAEARSRALDVAIVVDFVHVIEYIWKAAWSFHDEADPAAEHWVRDKATAVLDGNARQVAAGIPRAATRRALSSSQRAGADACADYLINKAACLD